MESTVLSKSSVYDSITEKIVAAMRDGAAMYVMPWHSGGPPHAMPINARTGAEYRGINILALWLASLANGYSTGYWASYRQWQALGAHVYAGQRGTMTIFYKKIEAKDDGTTASEEASPRLIARASRLFNADQVEGWQIPAPERISSFQAIKSADAFIRETAADIRHGGAQARYLPSVDRIEMPDRETFIGTMTSTSTESYYAVLLHELTHWSGASHRLNREFGKRFGDNAYAMEELVAELGAAFLCAKLGIANEPRVDHAQYMAGWMAAISHANHAVFTAARHAQQAAEFLLKLATSRGWPGTP